MKVETSSKIPKLSLLPLALLCSELRREQWWCPEISQHAIKMRDFSSSSYTPGLFLNTTCIADPRLNLFLLKFLAGWVCAMEVGWAMQFRSDRTQKPISALWLLPVHPSQDRDESAASPPLAALRSSCSISALQQGKKTLGSTDSTRWDELPEGKL